MFVTMTSFSRSVHVLTERQLFLKKNKTGWPEFMIRDIVEFHASRKVHVYCWAAGSLPHLCTIIKNVGNGFKCRDIHA